MGFVYVSIAAETHVRRAGGVGLRQNCLPRLAGLLHSKLALCRYVTAAGQSDRSISRFIGTCRDLNFLPPPTLPAFWGVPECNTQVHPSPWCVPGRLFVAGNTCLLPSLSSSFLLSLSLSLSFSLFFSFLSLPFLLASVSLDAFVIVGNPFLPLLLRPSTLVS